MTDSSDDTADGIFDLLDSPDLAAAIEGNRFKQFLDQVPVAIAISAINPAERVVYTNAQFRLLTGQDSRAVLGQGWRVLPGDALTPEGARSLGQAVSDGRDYIGSFTIPRDGDPTMVNAWSNIIEDKSGAPIFRLVALVELSSQEGSAFDALQDRVREKDTQLRELQHRVKNNLQMITALIRMEARGVTDLSTGEGFDRLAGRVEALGLLYHALAGASEDDTVDLGIYLSEIASAVMRAHAVEGIRLDLQVDTWPVSIDVAMPAGLVVNELLTNALKHAFKGRSGGTITLHSTTEESGCCVVISDDGVGLPDGVTWPKQGKLSALIARSLVQNANARIDVQSAPGKGMKVSIAFNAVDAAPAHPQ